MKILKNLLNATLLLGLIAMTNSLAAPSFEDCKKVFLEGRELDSFLLPETENGFEQNNKVVERVKSKPSCESLLQTASLGSNGILKEKSLLASQILKVFNQFHHLWLMPPDLDRPNRCMDKSHQDIYDFRSPAYHLTRALFQNDRKVSLAVTAYADLRSLRAGNNPEVSKSTGRSEKDYESAFSLDEEFQFTGDKELIGFLYRRKIPLKDFEKASLSKLNDSFKKTLEEGKTDLYDHLGGGFLGNPAFLIHYAPSKVYEEGLFLANGRDKLHRRLAQGILENILCVDLLREQEIEKGEHSWNHPITKEAKCLNCHLPLDAFASGIRNITYLKAGKSCSSENPQILLPKPLTANYSQDFWTNEEITEGQTQPKLFSLSYPVGYIYGQNKKPDRFVGLRQLGNLIAADDRFYQCQVKKYYQFIFNETPPLDKLLSWSKEYKDHQDGFKLLNILLKYTPEKLEEN